MPAVTAIFLVAALMLAVVLGPQTQAWTWGPAMVALGIAVLAAVPAIWKRGKAAADWGVLGWGWLAVGWVVWRAGWSPVAELGQADLMLLGGVVGAFVSLRAIAGNALAERILVWGIALLLLANLLVIGQQLLDPAFTPVFSTRAAGRMITGFYAHYNEAANYLIASAMMMAAAGLFGRHHPATRVMWLGLALAALAGVWFTRSRGGIIGGAVACGVLAALALITGKRCRSRWFAPALIAIPVMGVLIGAFLIVGWQAAQGARQAGSGIDVLLDNSCRLYFLGIALSCLLVHPWVGGGSRSFSWDCFQFMDPERVGTTILRKPEFVHNELVQAATDYGLIGAGLVMGLLAGLAIAGILRVMFEERPAVGDSRDAWRIGALAALAGMFVQSCFSFVFHLLPGILLLGICLGQISRSQERPAGAATLATRMMLSLAALACAVLLLPNGWKGLQVGRDLWPAYFSRAGDLSMESRTDALTEAIRIWPQASFYQERAAVFQELADSGEPGSFREHAEQAVSDYQEAARRHCRDPGLEVNRANLLSQLQRDAEAEDAYAKAIVLQGGMEPGFRGHFSLAKHLLRKGLRVFDPATPAPAHEALELAATQIETAVVKCRGAMSDMGEPRLAIHENLGVAREAVGDRAGALREYDFVCSHQPASRAHYRAAMLLEKSAIEAWSQRRPGEALSTFMAARKRLEQAGKELPQGVSPSQRLEHFTYLDRMITFLRAAKIVPVEATRQALH